MNTNNTLSDQEMMNALCGFVLGKDLTKYTQEEQEQMIQETLALTYGYLTEYMESNYDTKDVVRLKEMFSSGNTEILDKFPQTNQAFQQSLKTMIESLS